MNAKDQDSNNTFTLLIWQFINFIEGKDLSAKVNSTDLRSRWRPELHSLSLIELWGLTSRVQEFKDKLKEKPTWKPALALLKKRAIFSMHVHVHILKVLHTHTNILKVTSLHTDKAT